MLNNQLRIIWVKLRRKENPHFYLSFPVSLPVFQELLGCAEDLLEVVCFFAPNKSAMNPSFSVYAIKEFVQMTMRLFDALTEGEPYDLVDVTADNINISIQIK